MTVFLDDVDQAPQQFELDGRPPRSSLRRCTNASPFFEVQPFIASPSRHKRLMAGIGSGALQEDRAAR
jgi:hypothetical protein